ncbi:MAG: xanthine dehydrogenase family protein molybdopterin-binding subunit [Betaproteobacteria bacterium]|nr:MAG: xanthine dehydrogenase family protein molybdopterin-binding subunit [Betaproteobacteria bacterium]
MSEKTIRREDARLLKGSGRYTADWNLPGQVYAYFLRSDRAHAEIASIDARAAGARKGVHLVLTGADYAASGWKSLPGGVSYEGVGGQKQKKPFWPALAQAKVHYVGQPVALVVADSAALAQDASEDIAVEYRDLPAAIGFDGATRSGAPQLHADIPGNLAFEYESGDRTAVEAAFATAPLTSRFTLRSQRLVGNPIEPRAFLAMFDRESGTFTVYSPSQGMNNMRGFLSAATGLPTERIRVITELVGGSFGIRSYSYAEHVAVMLASQRLARPVKWVATRSEVFLSDNQGRGLTLTGELALDRDGRFLALRFEDAADLGAFATPFGAQIGTRNITVTMGGVYRIPAMYAHTRCAYSNAVPVSAYRGAGRPDIACAIERLVDHAAAGHGFDPIELRRKNFVPPDAMPYKTANGNTYDCGEFERVMDKALGLADWSGFPARRERSKREGKLRGLGVATFLESSAAGLAPKDQAHARFDKNGDLHVYTVSQSTGQGHETAFTRILGEGLGLTDRHFDERVRVHEGDPDLSVVGNGTGGSRSLYGAGSAVKLLAPKLIETAKPHAAAALGAEASAVEYRGGAFHAADRSVGFFELARKLAGNSPHPMDCIAEGTFGATFPNGCHVAEVEIDPEDGTVEVVNYATVDDVGTVVDHTSVEGQVHGGVLQGVGQALAEHAFYDRETGQLLAGSFMDYPMPRADWMRAIRCDEHAVPTKANALGAKGVGESGTSGALGATMNAILNAVRPAGIADFDMPVTPDRLWRALREARNKG